MIPLFTKCPACNHPAIRATRQCKTAMALFNDGKSAKAETLLKEAMGALRNA